MNELLKTMSKDIIQNRALIYEQQKMIIDILILLGEKHVLTFEEVQHFIYRAKEGGDEK